MDEQSTLNENVIWELRGELARRNISHADFARLCGWTPMYFSRRMTGQIPWSTDEVELIAKNLGLQPGDLMNGSRR